MKKKALLAALLGTSLILGACGGDKDKDKDKEDKPAPETEEVQDDTAEVENQVIDKSETTSSDEDLTEALNKEEGASNVRIIITEDAGGYVLVDFDADEGLTEDDANKVMDTFEKAIAEKYKDHSIDIQARKGGETFAQKTIEK